MAESPGSWKPADAIVAEAIDRAATGQAEGLCGLSEVRQITDALRRHGWLHDEAEPELGFDGLRALRASLAEEAPR